MTKDQKVIRGKIGLLELAKQLGKTPMQTFLDALPLAREKMLPAA